MQNSTFEKLSTNQGRKTMQRVEKKLRNIHNVCKK